MGLEKRLLAASSRCSILWMVDMLRRILRHMTGSDMPGYHRDARNSERALSWPCIVKENPQRMIGKTTREATHPVNAATQPSSAKVDT